MDRFEKDGVRIVEASDSLASRYGLLVANSLVCPKWGLNPYKS